MIKQNNDELTKTFRANFILQLFTPEGHQPQEMQHLL